MWHAPQEAPWSDEFDLRVFELQQRIRALRHHTVWNGVVALVALALERMFGTQTSWPLLAVLLAHLGVGGLLVRGIATARYGVLVLAHALTAVLVLRFGHQNFTHGLWLAVVPLNYVVFSDDEKNLRAGGASIAVLLFVVAELLSKFRVLPNNIHSTSALISLVVVSAMALLLMHRTESVVELHRTLREQSVREAQRIEEASIALKAGSFSSDLSAQRTTWSLGLYALYGLDPRRGPPNFDAWALLAHPDDRERVCDFVQQFIANPTCSCEFEYRIVRPDGKIRTIAWNARAALRSDHTAAYLLGTARDITIARRNTPVESDMFTISKTVVTRVAKRSNILLVCNEHSVLQLVTSLAQLAGHSIAHVNNQVSAFEALENEHFDLVLLDAEEDRSHALKMSQAIRNLEDQTQQRPYVVMMFEQPSAEDNNTCLAAGVDACAPRKLSETLLKEFLEPSTHIESDMRQSA
jgi:CheY-like chemotaxis protein/PAS domain-containing protein